MRSDAIKPGDVIAGKYRVRAILSRSRGFLVEAFHTEFDQRVVIRVLSTHLVDDKEVERFRREARILAKLESEYVARILDVGTTQDGAFFFARQYLEGMDLATYAKQRGPLPFAEAVLYTLQASEAVAETHVHSIILRELQPAHLFLTQRLGGQQIKVTDFGTAKLMRDAAAPSPGGELTATAMFGLSSYSSPELVRKAKHVDVRTDVWSLGAILYQLLTGRPPFAGEMAALMLAIARDEPVPVTRYRRDVPAEIDSIIGWALAKDPDGRFANVHGFAHALLPFGGAEAQILVKRIGEITAAARQRKSVPDMSAVSDGDDAVTFDSANVIDDDDDEPRTAYRPAGSPAARPTYDANAPSSAQQHPSTPPLERTVFIADAHVPSSPASPHAHAVPPSRPSQPAFAGAAAERPSQVPSVDVRAAPAWKPVPVYETTPAPAWKPSAASPNAPASSAPASSAPLGPQGALATSLSASASTGYAASRPRAAPQKGLRMALAAVTSAAVLLTVVAVVLVFKGPRSSDAAPEVASARVTGSAVPVVGATGEAAHANPTPAATAAASPPPADTGTATQPVAAPPPAAATAVKVAAAAPPATAGAAQHPTVHVKADPPPAPPPPPAAAGGDNGTLVAVAVGGTCAFSVNGASKGTSSSLKLSLKPGTYSVTCAPSSGASKSKSVSVTSGGTAMAMFRL